MRCFCLLPGAIAGMLAVVSAAPLSAASLKFDFQDPKGVNSVSFLLDSEVEPIRGFSGGVRGELTFDPAAPDKTGGKLIVAAESLRTPNAEMDKALHGPDWLDVSVNPEISFEIKKIASAKKSGDNRYELKAVGDFSCKGITKELTITIHATYLKGAASKRMRGAEGDLLVTRADFKINRSDFDIKKGFPGVVVAEEIQISAQIVGMHSAK